MIKYNETIHPEDSLAFVRSITFIGGFLNSYSYFTRGGAFTTFHTGNLVRTGLSIVERDPIAFWNSFTPIVAGFLGAATALGLKNRTTGDSIFYKKVIITEIIIFSIIGLVWSESFDNIVNFVLSMTDKR